MFRYPFIQFGNLLDRVDLGGWMMLGCGVVIVAATVLTPAWLEQADMRAQRDLLAWQEAKLAAKGANYTAFNADVERGEPMLMRRLAWHEFQLKPLATEPVCDLPTLRPVAIDRWMDPVGPPKPAPNVSEWRYDSMLLRMLTGEPRPWVLAFGAWLILMGLMLNPTLEGPIVPLDEQEAAALAEDAAAFGEDDAVGLVDDGGTDVIGDGDAFEIIDDGELLVEGEADEAFG